MCVCVCVCECVCVCVCECVRVCVREEWRLHCWAGRMRNFGLFLLMMLLPLGLGGVTVLSDWGCKKCLGNY